MSRRIGRSWWIGGLVLTILVATLVLAPGLLFPNARAVPAGAAHVLIHQPRTKLVEGEDRTQPAKLPAVAAEPVAPDDMADDPAAQNFVNTKVMTRSYCYAGSIADPDALGGYGKSDNQPRKVRRNSSGKGLYLLAQPTVVTSWQKQPGMRLVLVNQTANRLSFAASDSRLSIIQEAQDDAGKWRPIEYLPSSWCGNSYHCVFLPVNHFWSFAAPRYQGTAATKLRFALQLDKDTTLYSNEFAGSINPEQFTTKEGHTATNLMDPYND